MNVEVMNAIAATGSRTEKKKLLEELRGDMCSVEMLRLALDPRTRFHLTLSPDRVLHNLRPVDDAEAKLFGAGRAGRSHPPLSKQAWWTMFEVMLGRLARLERTGQAAIDGMYDLFARAPSVEDAEWGLRVLHKDLACGVNVKTVVSVFPGLVQPFEVALAEPLNEGHDLSGVGFVEPKLDGLRMAVVAGLPLTRQGNEVQGVGPIMEYLEKVMAKAGPPFGRLDRWVFDGEVIGEGDFESTISKARTKGQEDRGLMYWVFDMIKIEEWESRRTRPFWARRRNVEGYIPSEFKFGAGPVRRVASIKVQDVTTDELLKYRDQFIAEGYEGAMWKRGSAPYSFKRTDDVVKIKKFDTVDVEVVDRYEGEGKHSGRLGGLVVRLEDGTETRCGGGFTDAQRTAFWKGRLPAKTAEVQFQNRTKAGRLRFPVFIRFRPDKD